MWGGGGKLGTQMKSQVLQKKLQFGWGGGGGGGGGVGAVNSGLKSNVLHEKF